MYCDFYRLHSNPFSETPDPKFFYPSVVHKTALVRILNAVEKRQGFILLTGAVGSGKTLLARSVMEIMHEDVAFSYVLQPQWDNVDLLSYIIKDFGLSVPKVKTMANLTKRLNDFLLKQARKKQHSVIIIDEAQHLSKENLEMIRLLNNLEQDNQKLLSIILVAQEEINQKLEDYSLRQFKQRISLYIYLHGLMKNEVEAYLKYRIEKSGGTNYIGIKEGVYKYLFSVTQGNPRKINICMTNVLQLAKSKDLRVIDVEILKSILIELGQLSKLESILPPFLWNRRSL